VHDFLKSLDNLINNFNKKKYKNVFLRQKCPFLCTYALTTYAGTKKPALRGFRRAVDGCFLKTGYCFSLLISSFRNLAYWLYINLRNGAMSS
jgi:hypothetical protein